MNNPPLLIGLFALAMTTQVQAFQTENERNAARQAELDRVCEAARAVKLAPFRQQAACRASGCAHDRRRPAGSSWRQNGP